MSRKHAGRFSRGRKADIRNLLKYDWKLRHMFTPKQKKYIINKFKENRLAGGVFAAPGSRAFHSEYEKKIRSKLKKRGDPISYKETQVLDRRLRRYMQNLQANPDVRRGKKELYKNPKHFGEDPRKYLDKSVAKGAEADEARHDDHDTVIGKDGLPTHHPLRPGEPPAITAEEKNEIFNYLSSKGDDDPRGEDEGTNTVDYRLAA